MDTTAIGSPLEGRIALTVATTIDYMYSSKASGNSAEAGIEKVQGIYESFRFSPLWTRLGDCLSIIEEKPEMDHIATVLLPLIESLMVVCKYVGPKTASGAAARGGIGLSLLISARIGSDRHYHVPWEGVAAFWDIFSEVKIFSGHESQEQSANL